MHTPTSIDAVTPGDAIPTEASYEDWLQATKALRTHVKAFGWSEPDREKELADTERQVAARLVGAALQTLRDSGNPGYERQLFMLSARRGMADLFELLPEPVRCDLRTVLRAELNRRGNEVWDATYRLLGLELRALTPVVPDTTPMSYLGI